MTILYFKNSIRLIYSLDLYYSYNEVYSSIPSVPRSSHYIINISILLNLN